MMPTACMSVLAKCKDLKEGITGLRTECYSVLYSVVKLNLYHRQTQSHVPESLT